MPFLIPSQTDILKRVRSAFRAEMPGTDVDVWPSNIYVSAKVIGGALWEVMKRLAYIDKQRFIATCDAENLAKYAKEYGMGQKPPTYSQGNVLVPAVYPFTVPAGAVFSRVDGLQYTSTQSVALLQFSNSDTLSVPVVCNTVGKIGNLSAGAALKTSLSGVTGVVVDDNGLGLGADIEPLAAFRARVLARKRQPPMGGSAYDYQAWALEVPGVTRVFVAKNAYGPGTVAVWFLMDDTYPQGLPQLSDVANVQAHLEARAPVTACVIAQAPIVTPLDIVVSGFAPNTQKARESAAAELYAMFRNMVQPGLPGHAFTLHQSWIWQAVGNAAGEQYHKITYPPDDQTYGVGVMPCLNSVTFN